MLLHISFYISVYISVYIQYKSFAILTFKVWSKAVRWKDTVTQTSTTLTSGAVVAKDVHSRAPELRAVLVTMNVSIAWDVSGFKSRPFFDTLEGAADQAIALAKRTTIAGATTLVGMAGYQVEVDGDGASKWMRMRTEEVMATSSFVGCSISVVVAFVVLALATGNVVIALYSLVCIAGIIVSCVGYMHVIGWKYGTMEAICVTICVGFSVDFVVHVAIAYSEEATPGETRYQRTERALTEMGYVEEKRREEQYAVCCVLCVVCFVLCAV